MIINPHSRKGTTSVFLMIILASMLMTVGLFIHAAVLAAGRSYADAVFDLAGRSILSEYDLQLQKRYGLFAVHTDETEAEEKIEYYSDYSFHDNYIKEAFRGRNHKDVLRLELESVCVNLKGYSLTDTNLFEKQILEYMKMGILKDKLSGEKKQPVDVQNRVLRNSQIINCLPSNGYQSSTFIDLKNVVEKGLPDLDEICREAKDDYLVNEYIITHFANFNRMNDDQDTFFQNEIEYILNGDFSDENNYHNVRNDLFIMRNVLNLIHIKSDAQKVKEAEAVAAILTIGKGEKVGAPVVMEAWAAAESENDMRILEDGNQVALVKSKENWAVPISRTLEYIWKDGYSKPTKMSGYRYEDYLRILLYLENREKKLLRCMDLIQINMKGSYYRDFDLKEYYGGFYFEAVVQDRTFTYDQKY